MSKDDIGRVSALTIGIGVICAVILLVLRGLRTERVVDLDESGGERLVQETDAPQDRSRPGVPEEAGQARRNVETGEALQAVAGSDETGSLLVGLVCLGEFPRNEIRIQIRRAGGDYNFGVLMQSTDNNGNAAFESVPSGKWVVEVKGWIVSGTLVDIKPRQRSEIRISLPHAMKIEGRVVNVSGAGVADAEVMLAPIAMVGLDAHVVCSSNFAGEFAFFSGYVPCVLAARSRSYAPSKTIFVPGLPGKSSRVLLRLGDSASSLTGVIMSATGTPIARALVRVGAGRLDRILIGKSGPPLPLQVFSDEEGRFVGTGLGAGLVQVSVAAEGFGPWVGEVRLEKGKASELEVKMDHEAVLHGLVLDSSRKTVAGALVEYGVRGAVSYSRCLSGADGKYLLARLPEGRNIVRAKASLGVFEGLVESRSGHRYRKDLVLNPGRCLEGQVVDAVGAPVPNVIVAVREEVLRDGKSNSQGQAVDLEGKFSFVGLPMGRLLITLRGDAILAKPKYYVEAGMRYATIVVERRDGRFGRICGMVRASNGVAVVNARVKLLRPGQVSIVKNTFTDEKGEFFLERVYPDLYDVKVEPSNMPYVKEVGVDVGPFEEVDLGSIGVPVGGTIVCRSDEAPPNPALVKVLRQPRLFVHGFMHSSDRSVSRVLLPGNYFVYVRGKGFASKVYSVKVMAGKAVAVRLRFEAASRVTIKPQRGSAVGVRRNVRFRAIAEGQTAVDDYFYAMRPRNPRKYWLASGRYKFVFECEGWSRELRVDVPPSSSAEGLVVSVPLKEGN